MGPSRDRASTGRGEEERGREATAIAEEKKKIGRFENRCFAGEMRSGCENVSRSGAHTSSVERILSRFSEINPLGF